ncbi:hypothetical protein RCH12_002721 [Cryobacterium sp. MP_3.1]|uniref:hypothetical protein n=1 Tax=Cryobacterium sp. MP_3.1 TaxID=3071711 RepID=UPI002DFDA843|nr:hypothetical protein [Cryobacterium sp. MP_3.1]
MNILNLTVTATVHAAILDQISSIGSAELVASFSTAKVTPGSTVELWCEGAGQAPVSLAELAFDELEAIFYGRLAQEDVDLDFAAGFGADAAVAVDAAVLAWAEASELSVEVGECDADGQLHYPVTVAEVDRITFTDHGVTLPHSLVTVTVDGRATTYTARELKADLDASGRDRTDGVYMLPVMCAWFFLDTLDYKTVTVPGDAGGINYTITAA